MECKPPSNLFQFEIALRAFFGVLATHVLAGEVDTTLEGGCSMIINKMWWLLRYYNPVNLCWRYYSIMAYRLVACEKWGLKQLALINHEAHPHKPSIPYIVGEMLENYVVKRVEISGIQVVMSVISAYQGMLAVRFAVVATAGVGSLASITKPLAVLGLFRVIVSRWIASKVYVEPFAYPNTSTTASSSSSAMAALPQYTSTTVAAAHPHTYTLKNKLLVFFWAVAVLGGLLLISFWPYFGYSPSSLQQKHYLDVTIQLMYQYVALSMAIFHVPSLVHGPLALGNRLLYFDHWSYKAQTFGFFIMLVGTFSFGVVDFVQKNYYRYCEF